MVETNPEHERWKYEQNMRAAERTHDKNDTDWFQANEGAMAIGNIALRTAVLINGGAAIAALSFISSLVNSKAISLGPQLSRITESLTWFALGVAIATIAMGFGYLVNYSNSGVVSRQDKTYVAPYLVETSKSKRWRTSSKVFTLLAIGAAAVSIGFFIYGMFDIKNAVTMLQPPTA